MLILIMIEDMLADLGCEAVNAATTASQALAVIEAQIFDVAMLDMNQSCGGRSAGCARCSVFDRL